MRNIVLIGLSGSGKTTLGQMAAEALGLGFIDLDREVERRAGLSVRLIFEKRGEEYFRSLEAEATREAAGRAGCVIAAGGGVVLRRENTAALRAGGLVVFLDRPVENILRDLPRRDASRPLLAADTGRLRVMAAERRPIYLAAADVVLANEGGPGETLAGLLAAARAADPADGFAVIGDPIAHSLSPVIHGAVFAQLGLTEAYRAVRTPKRLLPWFVDRARETGLGGFNVTIPHKQDILPLLDEAEGEAALCGAVNAVVRRGDRLIGRNTDMDGLALSLRDAGFGFAGRRVLILGAGGAAVGAAFKAAREGAAGLVILARRLIQAEEAAAKARAAAAVPARAGEMSPETMARAAGEADILINCTPLGLYGAEADFQSFDFLKRLPPGALVYDLIYNPPRTRLLREAEKLGLAAQNGLGMLINQAILADEFFLARRLDRPALYGAVLKALKERGPACG